MNPKRRFHAALGLFLVWIGTLAAVAFQSSEKPREIPTSAVPAR